jgi:thiol-disulfide isomerase/thioredoxin
LTLRREHPVQRLGRYLLLSAIIVVAASFAAPADEPAAKADPATVDSLYPGLASGALTFSIPADLPEDVIVRAGDVTIDRKALDAEIAKAPAEVRDQLQKNGFFMAEQLAGKEILLSAARKDAATRGIDSTGQSEENLLQGYVGQVVKNVEVTDAEAQKFYAENKDMCGTATLDQISGELKQYILGEKRQAAIAEHVRTLGKSRPIEVSAAWVKEQAVLAKDNPVDKARSSGIPTMVDFGASGCRPCDMMTPVLASLKTKYEGRVNVLFVHVREQQILATRYGIESIPVQVFFDKAGKETFRHVGFFPQEEIEKKLGEMGVK